MITVYGRATSSNVQAVMWCLGELGLTSARLDYGHVHGGLDTAEFRALNPHGLIPVLVDKDGPPIWESSAIIRYLAARYGDDSFWPGEPGARAQIDMWAEWAKTTLLADFTVPIFWTVVRTRESDRDEAALRLALKHMDANLQALEEQLQDRLFVCGDHLTPADIVAGHILYRFFSIDIDRQSWPNVEAYYERLQRRPAFRDHVMVSYDSLRAE